MTKTDFSRHQGLLDHDLMSKSSITVIGTGGAAGLICSLARCGIGEFVIVEFDHVSETNPVTQGYDTTEIGLDKATALGRQVKRINPEARVRAARKRYQDLSKEEADIIWSSDIILAMTDDFHTQAQTNRDAITRGKDVFFAICYIGNDAVEITATFPDQLENGVGCHHCHTKDRYDGYEQRGFQNPEVIPSTALAADYLNSKLGLLIVSRLHDKAKSTLSIASLSQEFATKPMLTCRIYPEFWSGEGQPLADIADDQKLFTTRQWALDTPDDWVCPDCGTQGVVSHIGPQEVPTPHGEKSEATQERSEKWLVQLYRAVFATKTKTLKEEAALPGRQ
ncbi:MAG: ThiF family adenylyltransferase [Hyphomicrobiaceae bacterium]|nr:ThiF family adenylyltransferase [Hyphomicrobiaceae bacterium]